MLEIEKKHLIILTSKLQFLSEIIVIIITSFEGHKMLLFTTFKNINAVIQYILLQENVRFTGKQFKSMKNTFIFNNNYS